MATKFEIAEQVKLERECIQCGIDKLHKNTRQVEEREYASASIYGVSSIKSAQSHIMLAIQTTFNRIAMRVRMLLHLLTSSIIYAQFNDPLQAHRLANIALKRTFDTVFSRKRKDAKSLPNTVANVCVNIGAAVEAECQMRYYEGQNPMLYQNIKDKYWLASYGHTTEAERHETHDEPQGLFMGHMVSLVTCTSWWLVAWPRMYNNWLVWERSNDDR